MRPLQRTNEQVL